MIDDTCSYISRLAVMLYYIMTVYIQIHNLHAYTELHNNNYASSYSYNCFKTASQPPY